MFGAFAAPRAVNQDFGADLAETRGFRSEPAWTPEEYAERFQKCRDYIFAGDVYQINLTFPLYGRFEGEPLALYRALRKRQPVAYGGVVALGGETIVSLSPEVFFEARVGRDKRSRPSDEGHRAARLHAARGHGARANIWSRTKSPAPKI